MTAPSVSKRGRRAKAKPSKPRKDFPLFPHAAGQWAKKIRGKLHYFGKWSDPDAAEREWERTKGALLEGREPDEAIEGDSLEWLCNVFLDSKELQRQRGELTQRAFNDYRTACKAVAEHFGKSRSLASLRVPDFERYRHSLPSTWSPTTINNHLRLVRVLFKYANDIQATDRDLPYRIGLKAVPVSVVRKHHAKQSAKEYTAAEIWQLHDAAPVPIQAFILLGINAAYGTMDIARLRLADIDFAGQWLGEPRGKTGIARGCWLWPETVHALREAIDKRPPTIREEWQELAFLTTHRRPWAIDGSTSHPLSQAFTKLKQDAGISKGGVGHYALRHTFATIAADTKDQAAVNYVMGHQDASMQGQYREGIDPQRIKDVCEHVRKWWLAGKPKQSRRASSQ